jgi:hypothetical protein
VERTTSPNGSWRGSGTYLLIIGIRFEISTLPSSTLATIVLAVVGLTPTGFSSTTEAGGAYMKEVHAPLWSYTDKMDKDQKETRNVEIRLIKIIKILQPKILEAFDEIVGGGEEKVANK